MHQRCLCSLTPRRFDLALREIQQTKGIVHAEPLAFIHWVATEEVWLWLDHMIEHRLSDLLFTAHRIPNAEVSDGSLEPRSRMRIATNRELLEHLRRVGKGGSLRQLTVEINGH